MPLAACRQARHVTIALWMAVFSQLAAAAWTTTVINRTCTVLDVGSGLPDLVTPFPTSTQHNTVQPDALTDAPGPAAGKDDLPAYTSVFLDVSSFTYHQNVDFAPLAIEVWTTTSVVFTIMPRMPEPAPEDEEEGDGRMFVQTRVVDQYVTHTHYFQDICAETYYQTELQRTQYTTFDYYQSAASYLPPQATESGSVPACLGDEEDGEDDEYDAADPDEECVALGLDTACIGQCQMVDEAYVPVQADEAQRGARRD